MGLAESTHHRLWLHAALAYLATLTLRLFILGCLLAAVGAEDLGSALQLGITYDTLHFDFLFI